YFAQLLNSFTRDYFELLSELDNLPWHPAVLVNEYYSPFGKSVGCLSGYGMTPAKSRALTARLSQLDTVLAQGAGAFGFGVTQPKFTGHELCTPDPYVQGPTDQAPMHPNAAGELAIALADQQALPTLQPPSTQLPTPAPATTTKSPPAVGLA